VTPRCRDELLTLFRRETSPGLVRHEGNRGRPETAPEIQEQREGCERHPDILAHGTFPGMAGGRARVRVNSGPLQGHHVNQDDLLAVDTESGFARAIREHLELKSRNAELDTDMPIDRYLDGDALENHPLFKSEEQARIEETMDGEPASELSSERVPWPGEETAENAEGAALDEALWTGRPRDFDWGD
jgi:hypothetical protein